MHFLSSKVVFQLQNAFSCILDSKRIKEGEFLLQKLRKQPDFEVAIATFISRSSNYNQRLLGLIQLEKKRLIQDYQTVWSLKEVYFKDGDKISKKIRKLVTYQQNIQKAGQFLKIDSSIGGSAIYRRIELVFSLLQNQQKANLAVQYHQNLLFTYFQDISWVLDKNQDCYFFVLLCLALFYQECLLRKNNILQKLCIHWKNINQKSYNSDNNDVTLMRSVINLLLLNENIQLQPKIFQNLLNRCFLISNPSRGFLSHFFALLVRLGRVGNLQIAREQFIKEFLQFNRNKNNQLKANIRKFGQAGIFSSHLQQEDKGQKLIILISKQFIQTIFEDYEQWLRNYLQNSINFKQSLEILTSMINFYDCQKLLPYFQIIRPQFSTIKSIFQEILNAKENRLSLSEINQLITYLQFLTKYKSQISLSLAPNFAILIADLSKFCPIIAPFCDTFLASIWTQLSYLPFEQLVDLTQQLIIKISDNDWGVRFRSYQCILRLIIHMQQFFRLFTICTSNDSLLINFLNAHHIMCELIRDNKSKEIQFQIFHLLITVTKFIVQNTLLKDRQLHLQLNIQLLVQKIDKYLLLNQDTAIIVAFHRYHTRTLRHHFQLDKRQWSIDELDYAYRIQLYLEEINYVDWISLSQKQQLKMELAKKIIQFLKSLSATQFQKLKLTSLWDRLEYDYNISRQIVEKMDIQG